MLPTILLWVYCGCIITVSLLGGALPNWIKLTHRRMQFVMSGVGGLMLGVAILHMIPHSVHAVGSVDQCMVAAMIGLLAMFLMIRVFHVHQHSHEPAGDGECCEHDHAHGHHDHGHSHAHAPAADNIYQLGPGEAAAELKAAGAHQFSWLGLAIGLALHTMIDGMALAAAIQADASHHPEGFSFLGVGTFLAVLLHKPLDALSITSTMAAAGWTKRNQFLANLGFSLMCPAGAFLFAIGISTLLEQQSQLVGLALAFSGGVFLCISLADLLPEVTFHSHDRVALTLALFLGVALAWGIGFIEPAHLHHDHDHTGHNHAHPH